ncbi:hypothetical protein LBMAG26_01740 [Bacteroidota bacterium]|nr:hypothetical protein LBMAG26_01740 [Bacteroidota bacterium]
MAFLGGVPINFVLGKKPWKTATTTNPFASNVAIKSGGVLTRNFAMMLAEAHTTTRKTRWLVTRKKQ